MNEKFWLGLMDALLKPGNHSGGKRRPRNWRAKRTAQRKQARASRKINRQYQ